MLINKSLILLSLLYSASSTEDSYTVIIIGAGPSGLAASTKLLENNVTNIKIIEAESRIGGRVNSVKFGDAFIDLGAEWCVGEKDNIVYELVKDYNLLATSKFSINLVYSNGAIDGELKADLVKFVENYINSIDNTDNTNRSLSIGQYLYELYNSTIIEKYKNDKTKLKIVLEAVDYIEHLILGGDSAFDWNDITTYSSYVSSEGNQSLNWNGLGYRMILDVLLKKYPDASKALPVDDKLLLSTEVTKINWFKNSSGLVEIECLDGTTYKATYVIFTPSVGVLKAKHRKLFNPGLPAGKINAIENIGFGAIIKVPILFTKRWWKSTDYSFSLLWSTEEKHKVLQAFPQQLQQGGISWVSQIQLFVPTPNNPNVLIAWITGPMVPDIEKLSNEIILNGCLYTLRKFLGATYNITEAKSVIHTSWATNPHFYGSWSYDSMDGYKLGGKIRDDLAEPLKTDDNKLRVLFAGAASNTRHFATVHGAIETGHREADRIIALVK